MGAHKKKALLIGIDAYSHDPLVFARNDAEEFATLLGQPEFGWETQLLVDQEATKANIYANLDLIREDPPAQLLVYFSGHGYQVSWGHTFLATVDASRAEDGVDVEHLSQILSTLPGADAAIAILDCCHAGAFPSWGNARAAEPAQLSGSIKGFSSTRAVFAACLATENAYSVVSSSHGAFTHFLLDGLSGAASDYSGQIALDDIVAYVRRHLPYSEQTTVYRGDTVGRTVLASGFAATGVAPLTRQQSAQRAEDAKSILRTYQKAYGEIVSEWTPASFGDACVAFRAVTDWFTRTELKHPEVRNNEEYKSQRHQMIAKLAVLQHLEPGQVLDGRRIMESIGTGGFGSVWRLESLGGSDAIALKVLNPGSLNDKNMLAMFDRGYRAMERLDHERIVKVRGKTSVPLGFYMDYIPGHNLRTMMPLTDEPAQALRLLVLAAETVRHAHERGVVHRDIKPENLLLRLSADGTWLPYLTDFDLAWFSTATTIVDRAMAALSYGAPEYLQAPRSGAAHLTTVDTFGFAQLAFFVVIGDDPAAFQTAPNLNTLRRRLGTWESAGVAQAFVDWYEKCSNPDFSERPSDFSEIIDDLVSMEVRLRNSGHAKLTREELLEEVASSIGGLGADNRGLKHHAFRSISGRTSMSLKTEGEHRDEQVTFYDVKATLSLDEITMNQASNAKARNALNDRVDSALRQYPGAYKTFGQRGVYQVFIHIPRIAARAEGVRRVREILHKVLLAIETL
ncbi:MAG: protein kinase domain-containing protein [Angustibacter sp.]